LLNRMIYCQWRFISGRWLSSLNYLERFIDFDDYLDCIGWVKTVQVCIVLRRVIHSWFRPVLIWVGWYVAGAGLVRAALSS
jgi:hypothetical protein